MSILAPICQTRHRMVLGVPSKYREIRCNLCQADTFTMEEIWRCKRCAEYVCFECRVKEPGKSTAYLSPPKSLILSYTYLKVIR